MPKRRRTGVNTYQHTARYKLAKSAKEDDNGLNTIEKTKIQSQSPLLSLPAEVRRLIWVQLFAYIPEDIIPPSFAHWEQLYPRSESYPNVTKSAGLPKEYEEEREMNTLTISGPSLPAIKPVLNERQLESASHDINALLTCRQLYVESREIAYHQNVFHFFRPESPSLAEASKNIATSYRCNCHSRGSGVGRASLSKIRVKFTYASKKRSGMMLHALATVRPSTRNLFSRLTFVDSSRATLHLASDKALALKLPSLPAVEEVSVQCVWWYNSTKAFWSLIASFVLTCPRLKRIVALIDLGGEKDDYKVRKIRRDIAEQNWVMNSCFGEKLPPRIDHIKGMHEDNGISCLGIIIDEENQQRDPQYGDLKHIHVCVAEADEARGIVNRQWRNNCPEVEYNKEWNYALENDSLIRMV